MLWLKVNKIKRSFPKGKKKSRGRACDRYPPHNQSSIPAELNRTLLFLKVISLKRANERASERAGERIPLFDTRLVRLIFSIPCTENNKNYRLSVNAFIRVHSILVATISNNKITKNHWPIYYWLEILFYKGNAIIFMFLYTSAYVCVTQKQKVILLRKAIVRFIFFLLNKVEIVIAFNKKCFLDNSLKI